VDDALARQVRRQRLAAARLAMAWPGALRSRGLFLFSLPGTGVAFRRAFLELADQQLELLKRVRLTQIIWALAWGLPLPAAIYFVDGDPRNLKLENLAYKKPIREKIKT